MAGRAEFHSYLDIFERMFLCFFMFSYLTLFLLHKCNTFSDITTVIVIFSSPEPLGLQGELIVYPSSRRPSVVRPSVRPPFSKIFFSETAWPIKAKFYVEPPWEGGTKVCINGLGHMTKMAAMPIYGKNLRKSSSPEPAGRFP